nr:MAG TPA: Radical SAM superfamily [Caudoviricetes sp.]
MAHFWPTGPFCCYRCDFCDSLGLVGQKSGSVGHFFFSFGPPQNVAISTKSRCVGQRAIILYILID